jgi:hypothetical protein
MEFAAGLVVGILVTVIAAAVALFFLVRDKTPIVAADPIPDDVAPSVTVFMTEPFLIQQLREALASEVVETQTELQQTPLGRIHLKIKMNEATLDVLPQSRAQFIALMTFTAWGIPLTVRPVTEFTFVPRRGRVEIFINHIQIRGISIPRALVDNFVNEVLETAQTRLNHSLTQLQRDTGVQLTKIETTHDLLILEFAARPAPPREISPPQPEG